MRLDARRRLACRLFSVHLIGDIHERACDLGFTLPAGRKRRERIQTIVDSGLLFIHIPKAGGMSVSEALYGRQVKHLSIRLARRMRGGRLADLPSFAVLRDPLERFLSAYRYGLAGGSPNNDVAEHFRALYRSFRSIDDALDHVERAAAPYGVDHIYRPQSWYVTDAAGNVAVDRLIPFEDMPHLPRIIPGFPDRTIPRINRSQPIDITLSPSQLARLRDLYAADFALWSGLTGSSSESASAPRPRQPAKALIAG